MFDFGATMQETTRGVLVAILCDPDDADARFIEAVAVNRGATTRLFHVFEEARQWLESEPDAAPNEPDAKDGE